MPDFAGLDPFQSRQAKLEAWKQADVEPYPAVTPPSRPIRVLRAVAEEFPTAEYRTVLDYYVAGRILSRRGQGAVSFMDLEDGSGRIQLLFKKDVLEASDFERLEWLDLGDHLAVTGTLFVTKRGELTVEVGRYTLLSKALHPLPDAWKGLQDSDAKQRQRYAELIVSPETRERFKKRSEMVRQTRNFLHENSFIEVETPVLEAIPGGADAEPFVTHHNALDTDFYLRISLELHLKRLLVGGFDRVFEIGRVFRNEGLSPQHLQEFTMLEFYWAYASYRDLMPLIEQLYGMLAENLTGSRQVRRGENTLEFSGTWPRTKYAELLQQYAGIDILEATDEQLVAAIKEYRVDTDVSLGRGRLLDQLYKKTVRPNLIQPQFITDVPVEFSPLAKRSATDPRVTERVMVLIDGAEVVNGFSELNDPVEQRKRLEEQENLRLGGDVEAQRMDPDFLRALGYGMPPTAGFGVGIDRLMAILLDLPTVRETVFFPTMRPEPFTEK